MSFENIGKKLDSIINDKVKPSVKNVKDNKIKPATEKALEKGQVGLGKALNKGSEGLEKALEKGSEGLEKLAHKVSTKTEE